ncbi:MAG: hypothetical protein MRJ93_05270 [Nitrososphaeraceae archaeon]|nr:hypothetical protein [Nitrososphaeraceae archaeon]
MVWCGGGASGNLTGIFEGSQNITLQLANGKVLASAVKPFMPKGYSSIVS